MGKLNPKDIEVQLVALFVGMFIDQKIDKNRMLKLCTPMNLARTYDYINRPTGGS